MPPPKRVMAPTHQREAIEKLIAGLKRGDVSVMDEVFHDDALMDWPQFSERIRGRAEWVEPLDG